MILCAFWVSIFMQNPSINLSAYEIFGKAPVQISDAGVLCVADQTSLRLHLFDATGQLMLSTGAPGEGPGSFSDISHLQYCDGQFYVFDSSQNKVSLFSGEGIFVKRITVGHHFNPKTFPLFLSHERVLGFTNGASDDQPLKEFKLSVSDEGTFLFSVPFQEGEPSIQLKQNGHPIAMYYRWDPALFLAGRNQQAVFGSSNGAKIWLLNAETQAVTSITPQFRPTLVSDKDVAFCLESMPPNFRVSAKAGMKVPQTWPLIQSVLVDNHRQVWVFGHENEQGIPYEQYTAGKKTKAGHLSWLPALIFNNQAFVYQEREDKYQLNSLPIL